MDSANITRDQRGFIVTWDDQLVVQYPFIWLRDNSRDELHPQTRERVFDLTSVDLDIAPDDFRLVDDELIVDWPNKELPSIYPISWLKRHRPGAGRPDPAETSVALWNSSDMQDIPRASAKRCVADAGALRESLLSLKQSGIIIIDGLDDGVAASESFGDLIGFRRQTNFGLNWKVVSKPDPNNVAFTSIALPLHTDLPNQEAIPGYQFLHAVKNSAAGGESVFADGFRIAEDLRAASPESFELLKQVRIPFRFHDDSSDIRNHRAIISEGSDGRVNCFTFNAHIADLPDMDADTLVRFYAAYRELMQRTRDPRYAIQYRLRAGEMVVFDNMRVLHGRAAFDPESGERHFYGYYIEKNEVDSRIRVLSR